MFLGVRLEEKIIVRLVFQAKITIKASMLTLGENVKSKLKKPVLLSATSTVKVPPAAVLLLTLISLLKESLF